MAKRGSKKQREVSEEVEQLQKEIKELRLINRSLEKEIKKSNKTYRPEYSSEDLVQEEFDKKHKCEQCGKGDLIVAELGPRRLIRCSICDYKIVKKIQNG